MSESGEEGVRERGACGDSGVKGWVPSGVREDGSGRKRVGRLWQVKSGDLVKAIRARGDDPEELVEVEEEGGVVVKKKRWVVEKKELTDREGVVVYEGLMRACIGYGVGDGVDRRYWEEVDDGEEGGVWYVNEWVRGKWQVRVGDVIIPSECEDWAVERHRIGLEGCLKEGEDLVGIRGNGMAILRNGGGVINRNFGLVYKAVGKKRKVGRVGRVGPEVGKFEKALRLLGENECVDVEFADVLKRFGYVGGSHAEALAAKMWEKALGGDLGAMKMLREVLMPVEMRVKHRHEHGHVHVDGGKLNAGAQAELAARMERAYGGDGGGGGQ